MNDLIKIKITGLEEQEVSNLTSNMQLSIYKAFELFADNLKDEVDKETPVSSGNLKKNNKVKYDGQNITFKNDVEYAQFVYEGRKAIEGQLMAFSSGSGTVFTYRSSAVPENKFVDRGFKKAESGADKYLKDALAMLM
ncbi:MULTISPECIES: HK97 gp10 family phage protein [Pontibacillus]|uniref:HK97 gp10 family phage protein n=1 Tax=Pontibacillus chungwhensis TaxID=265426 RepID=A0ABY8V6W6_9BACI|nr:MULTISPECIES: HK97 gp10 family phage protein [Pontibacillus]MCD5326141.1 hypothetical protein [Pontibacillus sp. HN14]WIG00301.1 hypothetical protein QNI29_21075 [Pontibacillus chungwhensis]